MSDVTVRNQLIHDLETIAAHVVKAQDHLRVANMQISNLLHFTFDEADIQNEIEQARATLTQLVEYISTLHPSNNGSKDAKK